MQHGELCGVTKKQQNSEVAPPSNSAEDRTDHPESVRHCNLRPGPLRFGPRHQQDGEDLVWPVELVNQELWFNTQRRGIQPRGNVRRLLWAFAKRKHPHVSGCESTSTARASIPRRHSARIRRRLGHFAARQIGGSLHCRCAGANQLSPRQFLVGEMR